MSADLTLELPDPEATARFGRRLGRLLFPGSVVALVGPLGAGKTQLARAVAEGLGVADSRVVTSPTFVLLQEYPARLTIYHFDAYRLNSEAEFLDLDVQETFTSGGVCLIEWADRVPGALPDERLTIRLELTGEQSRVAHVGARGEPYAVIADALRGD